MYDFFEEHDAIPVAGVVEFVAAARDAGVTVHGNCGVTGFHRDGGGFEIQTVFQLF